MIPLENCKHGYLYKIDSRNLILGVFNQESKGFIGIREKFGDEFLFTEYHWDTGAPFGTVKPQEELCQLPENIKVKEGLGSVDQKTKRPVAFDKPVADGGRGWYFTDTNEADQEIKSMYVENKELFDWLKEKEKEKETFRK